MRAKNLNPIFVVATGRSGSTMFHKMMCMHPEVAWVNRILTRNPSRIGMHRVYLKLVDLPVVGDWLLHNGFNPDEGYGYWNGAYRGFVRPLRDLTANDVTERARHRFRKAVGRITTDARTRPLIKITGWSRIGFLAEIFPDARFIHVVRDGRAVANSFLNVEFWEGWQGPDSWRFGPLPPDYEDEWEKYNRSFVVLAGIAWKITIDSVTAAIGELSSDRVHTVRYEDLCRNPLTEFRRATEFADLEFTDRFKRRIESVPVTSRNEKWRTDLTLAQRNELNTILLSHLERLGYVDPVKQTINAELD